MFELCLTCTFYKWIYKVAFLPWNVSQNWNEYTELKILPSFSDMVIIILYAKLTVIISTALHWIFIGKADAEAEAVTLWPPDAKSQLSGKDPGAGKEWRQEEKGTTEDEMVG